MKNFSTLELLQQVVAVMKGDRDAKSESLRSACNGNGKVRFSKAILRYLESGAVLQG